MNIHKAEINTFEAIQSSMSSIHNNTLYRSTSCSFEIKEGKASFKIEDNEKSGFPRLTAETLSSKLEEDGVKLNIRVDHKNNIINNELAFFYSLSVDNNGNVSIDSIKKEEYESWYD